MQNYVKWWSPCNCFIPAIIFQELLNFFLRLTKWRRKTEYPIHSTRTSDFHFFFILSCPLFDPPSFVPLTIKKSRGSICKGFNKSTILQNFIEPTTKDESSYFLDELVFSLLFSSLLIFVNIRASVSHLIAFSKKVIFLLTNKL